MGFDNRTAYCEAHAHTVGLGREKRIEDAFGVFWINSCARILYQKCHPR
jgi:hypothetical protein